MICWITGGDAKKCVSSTRRATLAQVHCSCPQYCKEKKMVEIIGLFVIGTCKAQPFPLPPLSLQQEVLLDQCQQMSHRSLWTWKSIVIKYPSKPNLQNIASAQIRVLYFKHLICSPGSIKRSCDSSSPSGRYSHTHTDSASSYLLRGLPSEIRYSQITLFSQVYIFGLIFPWVLLILSSILFAQLSGATCGSTWTGAAKHQLEWECRQRSPVRLLLPPWKRRGQFWCNSTVTVYKAPATAFDLASNHLVLLWPEHKQPECDLSFS